MGKNAAKKSTTNVAADEIEQYALALAAKQKFMGATLGMSWRLAFTFLVPMLGGIWLDNRYNTTPSWTMVGFFVAVFMGSSAVWTVIKGLNQEQAAEEIVNTPIAKKTVKPSKEMKK